MASPRGPELDLAAFREAAERIANRVHRTPLFSATLLGEHLGVDLHLKAENLQKTGSFKPRGVLNKLLQIDPAEQERGVVTISAGNHAQALAWASAAAGVDCTVVMPESAPRTKVSASRGYGARVVLHGTVFDAFERAQEIAQEEGRTFVHPFDDPDIVKGQGTVGLEVLDALDGVEAIVVPVGGGGLVSGIAAAVKLAGRDVGVFGVEPEGAAAMTRSLEEGRPVRLEEVESVADGLAAPMAGELTFQLVREHVDGVVTVSDDRIAGAVSEVLSWTKLLVEPAGAAAVAALQAGVLPLEENATTVAVLSGGNMDMDELKRLL